MTTPHPHADLLIAIANGEQMQTEGFGTKWMDTGPSDALRTIAMGEPCRVKPKTITVNGVECPAPVKETGDGKWVEISCYARKDRFAFESWEIVRQVHGALIKPFNEAGK